MSFLGKPAEEIVKASVPINQAMVQEIANLVFPGESNKLDYESFIAAFKARPEYKEGDENQINQKLKSIIKKSIGPMQYGSKMSTYLEGEVDSKKLFEFVKLLLTNKDEFTRIIDNLSKIDVDLHTKGNARNEQEVKDLIEALINLQANALLAMVKPEVAPLVAAPVDALVTDIKKKIDAVNELLQVKPLVGGSYADPDLIKYMKYKAKYLKLKSKMQ